MKQISLGRGFSEAVEVDPTQPAGPREGGTCVQHSVIVVHKEVPLLEKCMVLKVFRLGEGRKAVVCTVVCLHGVERHDLEHETSL